MQGPVSVDSCRVWAGCGVGVGTSLAVAFLPGHGGNNRVGLYYSTYGDFISQFQIVISNFTIFACLQISSLF